MIFVFASIGPTNAQVAELADALDSGSSDRKVVEVRILSWAPTTYELRDSPPSNSINQLFALSNTRRTRCNKCPDVNGFCRNEELSSNPSPPALGAYPDIYSTLISGRTDLICLANSRPSTPGITISVISKWIGAR